MSKFKIYLSGAMTGIDKAVSNGWRKILKDEFHSAEVFNPWDYWDFESSVDDRVAMDFDIYKLRKSDLVVVNYEIYSYSVGTNMEIAIAHELRIPIIGYCRHGELHPWQKNMCERVFSDWDEMVNYIKYYYLEELA